MTQAVKVVAGALVGLTLLGWGTDLPRKVDQGAYYRGTPDECCCSGRDRPTELVEFQETIPTDTGTDAVVLFAVGVHVEPHREYFERVRYDLDRSRLVRLAEIVERHGGRLTVQVQRPFTEVAQGRGDPILRFLSGRGHEIALHFHEDFHLNNADARPVSDWVNSLRKEIDLIEALSGGRVVTWSGGNLYPGMYEAAKAVGLQTIINYKNPATQGIPAAFLGVNPWRPAGAGSVEKRTSHDPAGEIVYVPSGVWPAHCSGAEAVPKPYTGRAFDYVTVALRNTLHAAHPGMVNTFIATVHPGDFLYPGDDEAEFALWEAWLTEVLDPLVASGRVKWATVLEMAQAYRGWEGAAPLSPCAPDEPQRLPGGPTVTVWVASEAAPDRGIVVRLTYPDQPRYGDGTAAVVEVPGADTPGSADLSPRPGPDPYVSQGLVHVQFAFPGGGRPPLASGETYDHRGQGSLRALRDVVRFLRGEAFTTTGCGVADLLPYPVTQVGLIGLSNGGNTAVAAFGPFGEEMAVDWYVGWENPAGVPFTTVDLGGWENPNPAYVPGSCRLTPAGVQCEVDYSNLRWDPTARSGAAGPRGSPIPGVLYHDWNGDGRYGLGDYALGAYTGTFGEREKRVYSVQALEAAVARGVLAPWPSDVATLEEARRFWEIRDMSRSYGAALRANPDLRVIVIGSVEDHVQNTPDYPHLVLQYQGWLEAGIPWIRLNPDAAYVSTLVPGVPGAPESDANISVTYGNIRELLAPESVPDPILQLAAVLELADRWTWDRWEKNLSAVLLRTR